MNINLMPDEQAAEVKSHKSNYAATAFAIILVAAVSGVILLLLAVIGTKKKEIGDYNKRTEKIKQELVEYQDVEKTVIAVEEGTKDVNKIKDSTLKWSKLFPHLEKAMPENLRIRDYSYDTGKVSISGTAGNVDILNKFLQSLKSYEAEPVGGGEKAKLFNNVLANGYEREKENSSSVKFVATLEIQGGVLWN